MTAPTLLEVLLAGLRGQQPEQNCYLCLTSDRPGDVCAEHLRRLERIVGSGIGIGKAFREHVA